MITIGMLVFDDVEELDFVGPWEVFASLYASGAEGRVVTDLRARRRGALREGAARDGRPLVRRRSRARRGARAGRPGHAARGEQPGRDRVAAEGRASAAAG